MSKVVRWTAYARRKLAFLRAHGVRLDEDDVVRTVAAPERVVQGHAGRLVAQRALDPRHLLRVIYEETAHERLIVTCYPARRSRYAATHDV